MKDTTCDDGFRVNSRKDGHLCGGRRINLSKKAEQRVTRNNPCEGATRPYETSSFGESVRGFRPEIRVNAGQASKLPGIEGAMRRRACGLAKIRAGEIVTRHGTSLLGSERYASELQSPISHGLVSLLEMKRFYPDDLAALLCEIETCHRLLDFDATCETKAPVDEPLIASLRDKIAKVSLICSVIDLTAGATAVLNSLMALLDNPDHNLPGALCSFFNMIFAELKDRQFMYMPSEDAARFEQPELFDAEVAKAFPSSADDIREAGSCYATGRYTASVYHAICALEPALKALALSVRVKWLPKSMTWGQAVNAIETAINMIPTRKGDRKQFLSEAAAHFRFFKDAWRNDAMHARLKIAKKSDAEDILDHVRSFMVLLATRLKERVRKS